MKNAPKNGSKISDEVTDIRSEPLTFPAEEPDANRQLRLLEWAWEFLKRNPKYRNAYAQWAALPEVLKVDGNLLEFIGSGVLASFTVEWFDLDPEPMAGDDLGTWYERHLLRRDEISISIATQFDSASFMLARWLDPSLELLPSPVLENFFVPDLELEECRALYKFQGLPIKDQRATDSNEQPSAIDLPKPSVAPKLCGDPMSELPDAAPPKMDGETMKHEIKHVDVTVMAGTPMTTTFPDGTVELRFGSLIIVADRPTQIALRFDLALPLHMQLISAQRQLYAAQREFESTSQAWRLNRFRSKEQPQAWPRMLALLDAHEATNSNSDAVELYLSRVEDGRDLSDEFDGLLTALRRARAIRDGEYRGLIMQAFAI